MLARMFTNATKRVSRSLFLTSVLAVLALGVTTTPAGAAIVHHKLATIEGGFDEPTGVAVGPDGPELTAGEQDAVYVADGSNGSVDRFSSAGTPLPFECKLPATRGMPEGCRRGQADRHPRKARSGTEGVTGVAVDDATGEVFVSSGGAVDVFSEEGEYLWRLTGTCENPGESAVEPGACPGSALVPLRPAAGLDFDQKTGELYVADQGGVVDVFKREGPDAASFVSQFTSES